MSTPTRYRCTHVIEAMQWKDTPDIRDAFAAWFKSRHYGFLADGSVVEMAGHPDALIGDWVIWMDGEFVAMDSQTFAEFIGDEYELVVAP